jgi:hypothetical protein
MDALTTTGAATIEKAMEGDNQFLLVVDFGVVKQAELLHPAGFGPKAELNPESVQRFELDAGPLQRQLEAQYGLGRCFLKVTR